MALPAFVAQVASSPDTAQKLTRLGADTPEALLATILAGREAFDRFMGPWEAAKIVSRLRQMVGQDDTIPDRLDTSPGQLGARMGRAPDMPLMPAFDLAKRDSMFNHIETLRRSGAPAREVSEAERALDFFLRSPSGAKAGEASE